MTHICTYSPLKTGRRAAAVALGAGALALIAGCGGSGTGSAAPLTPRQAITLAADQTQHVNSIAATLSISVAGAVSETTTGSVQVQLKPVLLASEDLTIVSQGQTVPIASIVSSKAIYLKSTAFAALTRQTRKTWIEIPLSDLSGTGASAVASLLQNVQNGDPLTQTKMLAASKNVRVDGHQVIDGVRTTHYAGTFSPSAALATLPASLRQQVAPQLKLITGEVQFNAWIDARHQVRRVTEIETVSGATVNFTMDITSVNQPVHVTLPRAGRTMVVPASDFGSSSSGS
jgi:LppX_LprAFG lipoprotein